MIVYQFECPECGALREESLAIKDRDAVKFLCHRCDTELRRSVGCGGFELHGTCWSRDGYSRILGDDPRWKDGSWRNENEV